MNRIRLALIPGDGIGPELLKQVQKVIAPLNRRFGIGLETVNFPYGADYFLKTGILLPNDFLDEVDRNYDAVILGTLGDPRIANQRHAREMMTLLRERFGLFMTVCRITLHADWISPRRSNEHGLFDLLILKESHEGLMERTGGFFRKGTTEEIAMQTVLYTHAGLTRFFRNALQYTQNADRRAVCFVYKSNLLFYTHDLWKRVFAAVQTEYKGLSFSEDYLDAAIYRLIEKPTAFDVIVTDPICGDAAANVAIYLAGGYGLAAQAEYNPGRFALFRPSQSSAPQNAGRNNANPLGALFALRAALEYFGATAAAAALLKAIQTSIDKHWVTYDLNGIVGTNEVGDFIAEQIETDPN